MSRKPMLAVLTLVALIGLTTAPKAQAQQGGTFELLAGQYSPGDDAIGDDIVYGLRGGYRFSEHLGFDATLSLFQQSETGFGFGDLDLDLTLVDLSAKWYPRPGKRADLFVYGGPGWAFVDVSLEGFGSANGDSWTLHSGIGVEVKVTDRFYIRPDVRGRWIEDSSDFDLEATLGFGFRVGRAWGRGMS